MAAEYGAFPGSVLPEGLTSDSFAVGVRLDLSSSLIRDNIDLTQARPTSLIEQGRVISSSPGLETIELPVERYMFGEFDMRNERYRNAFEENAPADVQAEYRRHLRDREKGIINKQVVWKHSFPFWEAPLAKSAQEIEIINFESRRDQSQENPQELERVA